MKSNRSLASVVCGLALCCMIVHPGPAFAGHRVSIRLQISVPSALSGSGYDQEWLAKIAKSEKTIAQLLGTEAKPVTSPASTGRTVIYVYEAAGWSAALGADQRQKLVKELCDSWGQAVHIDDGEGTTTGNAPAGSTPAVQVKSIPLPIRLAEDMNRLLETGTIPGGIFDGSKG